MFYFGKLRDSDNYGFGLRQESFESFVEVSDEEHDKIIKEVDEKGKPLKADKDGKPVIFEDYEPPKEMIDNGRLKELENYLKETDWYVIRYADTGVPIPADIKAKRQEAREEISALRAKLVEVDKSE